jgi:hypothetical protein
MIRHYDPRPQFVKCKLLSAMAQRLNHTAGHEFVFKPTWTYRGSVQFAIDRYKSLPRGLISIGSNDRPR